MSDAVIISVTASETAIIVASIGYFVKKLEKGQKEISVKIDGNLEKMLELTAQKSHAEGMLQANEENKAENKINT